MPYGNKVDPLITTHEPCGCHLQAISSVNGCFSIASSAASFDKLLEPNHNQGDGYKGAYFTGTIVSIADYGGDSLYTSTSKELEKRGFQLLGTQPGAHGTYKMRLWGKGFTLPGKKA